MDPVVVYDAPGARSCGRARQDTTYLLVRSSSPLLEATRSYALSDTYSCSDNSNRVEERGVRSRVRSEQAASPPLARADGTEARSAATASQEWSGSCRTNDMHSQLTHLCLLGHPASSARGGPHEEYAALATVSPAQGTESIQIL